jgi:hypothetical protein
MRDMREIDSIVGYYGLIPAIKGIVRKLNEEEKALMEAFIEEISTRLTREEILKLTDDVMKHFEEELKEK